MPLHHKRSDCRACGGTRLERFLELGPQPPANSFLKSPAEFATERLFPLDVYFCCDCSLVQLLDVIDPEVLFGHYVYVSGTSDTMRAHFDRYAGEVVARLGLGSADRVVEVGSNDGTLLAAFQRRNVQVLGVEPARNIAARANEAGVPTVNRFFSEQAGAEIREEHGAAAAVVGNNVFAHVDDTLGFLRGCRAMLAPQGRVIIESPYLKHLADRFEWDTIYHEHLCYFSVTALLRIAEECDMRIAALEEIAVHGGSLRVDFARREDLAQHAEVATAKAAREAAEGLASFERFQRFGGEAAANRDAIREMIGDWRARGLSLAAYGAPAKGNTLLNYCRLTPAEVPYIVDRNPLKIGLFTPGAHVPVEPVDKLLEDQPDGVLILAWNFQQEIIEQQAEYARRGGKFLVPIPQPGVLASRPTVSAP